MLWDLIRDFFVQHVFGGVDSTGTPFLTTGGYLTFIINGEIDDQYNGSLGDIVYKIGGDSYTGDINMSMADWLSTTATAIAITIIVALCCLFIYKIIRLVGGLIR